jgi:hypothetical protein
MTESLRGDAWAHKTSLTLPLFTEVPVPSQKSERSCICVLEDMDFASFYNFFYLILELFQSWNFLFFI